MARASWTASLFYNDTKCSGSRHWAEGSGRACLVQDLVQIKFYDFVEGTGV